MRFKKKANLENNNKNIFAGKLGFARVFMFFFIGSIIGTFYEQIIEFAVNGHWVSRSGLIYGPFNTVYGCGFALLIFFLSKNMNKRKWWITFIYAILIGGISEYVLGWIGEKLFNSISWDYGDYFLNIYGRTTIIYALFWGVTGFLFMKFVYPLIAQLLMKIPIKFGRIMLPILVVFMVLNMSVSYTALIRQAARKNGKPPATAIGKFYDKHYNDEYLKKIYPKMEHRFEKR